LFDSTILIAHLRGEAAATTLLLATPSEDRFVSVLSRTELEGGMRSPERADVARLFSVLHLVPVSDAIAARAGEHLRTYRRSHQGIDIVDFVTAASAEAHEAELVTLNTEHFPMFKGLRRPW
jgi:predicted nucleic acid-binding protein